MRSRAVLLDFWAEDIIDISDTQVEGERVVSKATGEEVTTEDMLGHRKLQVDSRKWLLSKLAPKKYGDKLQHGGAEDLPPIQSNVILSPDEAYKRLLSGGGSS
jgi:hypothetical protein